MSFPPRVAMEQAVGIARKLPDSKHMLARSLYYLSQYQENEQESESISHLSEATQLYEEHMGPGKPKNGTDLQCSDFDNLLVCYQR